MRSKFVIKIPPKPDKSFPSDEDLRTQIRTYGWEHRKIATLQTEAEKVEAYKAKGLELFKDMPEVAQEEKDDVIFCGFISADQTHFVVTHSDQGELTFRALQPELQKLIQATEKMIRAVETDHPKFSTDEYILNRRVLIYEKGYDHVIFEGRVVEDKKMETIKTNLKDAIVVAAALILMILLALIAFAGLFTNFSTGVYEMVGRIAVSIIIVFLVSAAGLIITYRDIKAYRIISWNLHQAKG